MNSGDAAGRSEAVAGGAEWDAYWQSPRLAACLRDDKGNYGGVIAEHWRRWFAQLAPEAQILDLATGNGAVALLALEFSDRAGLDWKITATDSARIDPPSALPHLAEPLRRIRFLGQTPAENLPFDDATFDAVTGQYALEYTEMSRTLGEAARVLRAGGRLMFITHRRDSSAYDEAGRQLELADRLTRLDLINGVRRLLGEQDGSAARAEFDAGAARAVRLLERCEGQGRIFISQFLQQMGEIYQIRNETGPRASLQALDELDSELASHRVRLRALQAAALSADDIEQTLGRLAQAGFSGTESGPISEPDASRPLGHWFAGVLGGAPPARRFAASWGPEWLLAGIDPVHDAFHFAAVSRRTYRESAFLDHRIRPRPDRVCSLTGPEVDDLLRQAPPPPAGWIFHTAFCCSTLLAFCLDHERHTLVLREPAVLSRLASMKRQPDRLADLNLVRRVISLLERPFASERVVIKPSNYANALLADVPDRERDAPSPRCVLLSCSLQALLVSVLKKRDEADRQLAAFTDALLADSDYRERIELPPLEHLELLQLATVFWHCQRYHFQQFMAVAEPGAVLGLTMERFLGDPAGSLAGISDFLDLGLSQSTILETVERGAFTRHAKLSGEYGPEQHRLEAKALEGRYSEEITAAVKWAGPILRTIPVEPLVAGEDPING